MSISSLELRRLMRVTRQDVRARAARRARFHSEATMDSTSESPSSSNSLFKRLSQKVKNIFGKRKPASMHSLNQTSVDLIGHEDIELQTSSESDTLSLTAAEIVTQSNITNLLVATVNGVAPTQLPFTMGLTPYEFAKKLALASIREELYARQLQEMFLVLPAVPQTRIRPSIPTLGFSKLPVNDDSDDNSVRVYTAKDLPSVPTHDHAKDLPTHKLESPVITASNSVSQSQPSDKINAQHWYQSKPIIITAVVIGTTVVVGLIIGGLCFLLTPAVVALMIGKAAIAVAGFVAHNTVPVAGVAVAAGVAVIGLVSFKKHLNEVSESADCKKGLVLLA